MGKKLRRKNGENNGPLMLLSIDFLNLVILIYIHLDVSSQEVLKTNRTFDKNFSLLLTCFMNKERSKLS